MKKNTNFIIAGILVLISVISFFLGMLLTGKIGNDIDEPLSEAISSAENIDSTEALGDIIIDDESEEIDVPKEFRITNHASTQISVSEGKVYFKGTSDPSAELTCNGTKVEAASTGEFSIDKRVTPGPNEFVFVHKGQSYTYSVSYTIDVLRSVSPETTVSVPAGMEIEIKATALKGSEVSALFNGKSYSMKSESDVRKSEDNSSVASEELAVYTVTVNAPEAVSAASDLGKISVTATCKGVSETMTGGNIKVTPKKSIPKPVVKETQKSTTEIKTTQKPTTVKATEKADASTVGRTSGIKSNLSHKYTNPPKTTEAPATEHSKAENSEEETSSASDRLQKYSFTSNYGLGSATVCQITDNYVEIFPGRNTKTYSLPNYTPLLKGTFDYVESEIEIDGDKYYILSSGYKVPADRYERLSSGNMGTIDHVGIKEGYITPANTIKIVSCKNEGNSTVIKLDMNKKVPFIAYLTGQSYKDYNGRPVAVSSCTCTGIKICFSQTASAVGKLSFGNSVISSGSYATDADAVETTITLNFASAGKFYGYHCEYDEDGYLVFSFKNKPSSLSGYTIMLDPGHGGIDSGAKCSVSASGMSTEKNINLSIATKVKELLEAEGATVLMTRSSDKWVCYTDRNDAVRGRKPDMFISIHCDGSEASSAYGTTAYYYRAYSQPLARAVHESITSAYKSSIYANESAEYKSKVDRGTNYYAFRVIRVEECPAILIEYGFVTNTAECQKLQEPAVRDTLARATVNGIKKYISAS